MNLCETCGITPMVNTQDRLFNDCIRFVFNLCNDHLSALRYQMSGSQFDSAIVFVHSLSFSFLNSPSLPEYLEPLFSLLCSNYDQILRSKNNMLLLCLLHTSNFINSSFFVQSVLFCAPCRNQDIRRTQRVL